MKKLLFLLIPALAVGLAMTAGGKNPAKSISGEILIAYSGNTLGELKPCGCAKEEDQGGFERRSAYLQQVRAKSKNTLVVDTGDNFKEPTRQGKIKAGYLMRAMAAMKYDAVAVGEHDLVYGNKFMGGMESIPWLASNLELEGVPLRKARLKTFGNGVKVAVLAVADPDLFYGMNPSGSKMTDPKEAVTSEIKSLENEDPDLIVLLTHMRREKALEFLELEAVDVVINGHIEKDTDVIDMDPVVKGRKIFVQPGSRGQKMGELTVRFGPQGEKNFEQRMVRLDSSVKFDPEMVQLYKAYNEEVEALFFATLKNRKSQDQKKVFATETVCKTCHPGVHEIWARSRHGDAYATLRKVNKAFDPECLKCHVTGFDEPGGFLSEVDSPELKNVQCEVCHGPGLRHTQAPKPGFGGEAKQACQKCHVKNHSPNFNYEKYWPKIEH